MVKYQKCWKCEFGKSCDVPMLEDFVGDGLLKIWGFCDVPILLCSLNREIEHFGTYICLVKIYEIFWLLDLWSACYIDYWDCIIFLKNVKYRREDKYLNLMVCNICNFDAMRMLDPVLLVLVCVCQDWIVQNLSILWNITGFKHKDVYHVQIDLLISFRSWNTHLEMDE